MKTKTDFFGLGEAISGIIQEYSDEVVRKMPDAVKAAAKAGLKELKSKSKTQIGGTKYNTSFKSKTTNSSPSKTEITLHSTRYRVAHLLEHGHVIKNKYGVYGVSPAHPHWAPAEKKANKMLEDEIRKAVEESG